MVQKQTAESSLEDLMDRYLKGDSQACEGLLSYLEHQKRVERIARKNTRGTSVSWEDAAQNAHLRVFQKAIDRHFSSGGVIEFYKWAAKVALNAIIDLVRRERREQEQCSNSLEQLIPGTDMPLWETIPDDYSLIDAVERADLVLKALEVIATIDQTYPSKGYLKLWRGLAQEKTQQQIAVEMGVTQGTIAKRWKELLGIIAENLGLLETEDVKRNLQTTRNERAARSRSNARW